MTENDLCRAFPSIKNNNNEQNGSPVPNLKFLLSTDDDDDDGESDEDIEHNAGQFMGKNSKQEWRKMSKPLVCPQSHRGGISLENFELLKIIGIGGKFVIQLFSFIF